MKDMVELSSSAFILKRKLPKSFECFTQNLVILIPNLHDSAALNVYTYPALKCHLKSVTNACIDSWNKLTKDVFKPSTLSTN